MDEEMVESCGGIQPPEIEPIEPIEEEREIDEKQDGRKLRGNKAAENAGD